MRLSPSSLTMGQAGCFVTSVCTVLHNYAIDWTPDRLLERLVAANGFTSGGYLTWKAVGRATDDVVYWHERVFSEIDPRRNLLKTRHRTVLDRVKRYLDLGQPVVLTVDAVGNDGIADHAITAYDYIMDPSGDAPADFMVIDPWNGNRGKFSELYGPVGEKLYGYVGLIGPPIRFPDGSMHKKEGHALWKAGQVALGKNVGTYSKEIIEDMI